jgi:DNA-binding transcriptional regulator YdaS (Cro superfamily)
LAIIPVMIDAGILALRAAKDILGTERVMADAVGASQPYVHAVLTDGKRVPAEWCIPVEKATEAKGQIISRGRLRPDLYPEHAAADGDDAPRRHGETSDRIPAGAE